MKITGPFREKERATSPWYLIIKSTLTGPNGEIILNPKGRPQYHRGTRKFYSSKTAAAAAKEKMKVEQGVTGEGDFLWNRGAADEYTRAKAVVGDVPLDAVAKFYRLHHPLGPKPKVKDLIVTFLGEREKGKVSRRYYSDLKSRLGFFGKQYAERYPETITRLELINYLNSVATNTRTRKNHKTAVATFFAWLCDEQIISANPASNIGEGKIGKVESNDIRFLSLAEAERYLRTAERYEPDLVAHEVVQLIAGVRADDEMGQFRSEHVIPQTKEVVIPAEISKTGQREVINTLEPSFWAWWEVYGPKEGLVRPANYGPRWSRLRVLMRQKDQSAADALAVLPLKTLMKRKEVAPALKAWPWNARRRTFCSFHIAMYQSADRTALILRHKGEISTLHDSYRGRGVTQEDGKAYFNLLPQRVAEPILPAYTPRGIVKMQMERRGK